MPKKALMIVGDFVEDYEAMVPLQTLLAVGCAVDVVCPGKEPGDKVKTAIHDFEGDQTYTEKPGHLFAVTASFDAVDARNYDALVVPGGRAPEYLRLNARVLDLIRAFDAAQKPIAAICHGAQLLAAAEIIRGKRVSAYPACAPEVRLAGAEFADIPVDQAIADGHIVSAPAWPAHPAFMAELIRVMGGVKAFS